MTPKSKARVLLGEIVGAHGIRGEVQIRSYTSDPEDIAAYGALSDEDGARSFSIKSARATAKGVVARLAGVTDRNAAEALRGTQLYADRAVMPPAEDGAYYHWDLIGLKAMDEAGAIIGEVVGVQNYGAGDILEVRLTGQKSTELIPFLDAFVPALDVAAGTATIRIPLSTGEPEPDSAGPRDEDAPDGVEGA